jgi:hypothetical protein
MNKQICFYCEKTFMWEPNKPGQIDVCPTCYEEHHPHLNGSEQEVLESWRRYVQKCLAARGRNHFS